MKEGIYVAMSPEIKEAIVELAKRENRTLPKECLYMLECELRQLEEPIRRRPVVLPKGWELIKRKEVLP